MDRLLLRRRRPCLNLRITRLYHRDDPILLGAPPGKPPHDYSYMRTVMKSAMIHDELVSMGVAGVTKAWAHESGGGRLFVAVSISQRHPGHARQVAHLAAQCPAAAYMNRYVVVVDDDIDVADLDQVIWAMSTRSDPARDIEVMRQGWGASSTRCSPRARRPTTAARSSTRRSRGSAGRTSRASRRVIPPSSPRCGGAGRRHSSEAPPPPASSRSVAPAWLFRGTNRAPEALGRDTCRSGPPRR
ncbi:hypothetical protein ACFQV8_16340 [Pseudonocardia benzenivorans]